LVGAFVVGAPVGLPVGALVVGAPVGAPVGALVVGAFVADPEPVVEELEDATKVIASMYTVACDPATDPWIAKPDIDLPFNPKSAMGIVSNTQAPAFTVVGNVIVFPVTAGEDEAS